MLLFVQNFKTQDPILQILGFSISFVISAIQFWNTSYQLWNFVCRNDQSDLVFILYENKEQDEI